MRGSSFEDGFASVERKDGRILSVVVEIGVFWFQSPLGIGKLLPSTVRLREWP